MSTLLNGNANLSADMAIRLEKAFGINADTLLRMQTAYELAQARKHEQDKGSKSSLKPPILQTFPKRNNMPDSCRNSNELRLRCC